MSTIRVVWGTASGPTELAAYDAALAEAGVENFNLLTLSSVIPKGVDLKVVGETPDLGSIGDELRVVQSESIAPADQPAAAGIGWARRSDGAGIFYEVAGADVEDVCEEIEAGLEAGKAHRGWEFVEQDVIVREATAERNYAAAVVLATYGESRPVV